MRLAWLLALGLVLTTACGEDTPPDKIGLEDVLPACSDVWVVGETLAVDYVGCLDRGEVVVAVVEDCVGDGKFTAYDDRLWATFGGKVLPIDSAEFRECQGSEAT